MTQEEKARAYDEAIKRGLDYIRHTPATEMVTRQDIFEAIFPEFKESDDEKTRKALVSFLKSPFVNENITDEKVAPWLAWLEKHGKQSVNDNRSIKPKFKIGDIISNGKVVYRVDNIVKNAIGQDCYFLVNVEAEKDGTRYLILTDSEGKTSHMGEITWLCEQVDKSFEKQDEQKSKDRYTFKSIPRLLEMIEPTDRAKAYCQKLIDSLLQEGYSTDAKIVSDCLKQMNGEDVPMATMDEQKPTDKKVEPKFRPGDWITNDICIIKITSVDDRYYWHDNDCVGGDIESLDKEYHLWTIKDAKDGDILMANAPFIFNGNLEGGIGCPGAHCAINTLGEFQIPTSPRHWTGHTTTPATKEQRDLLFAKMKEAGYIWDNDEKELRKIDQKPQSIVSEVKGVGKSAQSKEDTVTVKLQRIIDFLWHNRKGDTDAIFQQEQDIAWLKSLKQRLGGEK